VASIVAAAHVKFDFVDEQFSTTGSLQPAAQLANYNSLEAVAPGSIDYIEGLNEINNQPITYDGSGSSGQGQDELNAALAYQQTIYQEVTSDPALSGIGIAYFTGYDAGSIPVGPDPFKTSGLATADTQHPYPQFGQAPSYWVNPAPAFPNLTAEDIAGGAPMVYTETGYSSVPTVGGSGVDEATQARYSLDLLLDDAKNGIKTTYIYDINDDGPMGSSVDDGFGLFYAYDNTADPNGAKPAATAIHNMNVILADTGAQASSFTLNAIDFSVAGQTATSNNMEMQRSDNTSIIALWDEQPIWNDQTATEIAPTPHNETITFGNGSGLYNVAVYDPLTGTVPVRTATDVNAMTVSVSSDPLFIEVTPVTTTSTTTSDTVILNLGEAQASGVDAEFQVSINGTIVGTGTVGAAEMSGASDDVTYTGDFGTGSVDVAVTFLNGFAGNLLDAGRTLYVNSISVNGQADFENAVLEFDTTDTYTLQASPPTTPATEATPDTLTLNLSDTPLNGQGALFEVAVNGSLVGDPQLVTATAASGHSQNFTFTGDFGSDPTVTLDFINGFSGYAPAFGEELVVNSITLDGLATAENADQFYYGPASYTVAAGNTKGSTTPTKPTTPTTPVKTTPSGATIPMTQYVAPSTSGIGTDPMVTYNWNPATQLRSFLSTEAQGTASIVAIGDSTTSGIGSDSGNTEDIAGSYPSELTYWLNQDQIAAQDANFLGNNNDGGDTQVDLLGSTIWSGAQGASGQAIQTAGVGDGFSFTPYNPLTGNEVAVTYYSSGGGTLAVDVNGTQVGTIAIGNNYTMETTELSIPLQLVNTVTVTSTTPTADFLEGAAVSNTKSAAIQIYNAGQSGGTAEGANASETVGSLGNSSGEIPDTIQLNPSLVLINYGINDINDGLETPDQAASYVKQMVADFQAKGIDTIIIVPTPFASTYASEFPSYVNDLEGIAAQMNVPLINLSATYDNSEADLAAAGLMHDGIHPGAQLYADIGSGIAGLISKAIQSN
jgi:lysophospholipase L1-like esterase